VERKGSIGSKEKREIKGKGGKKGELGIVEYVSRIVSARYWQPYRLIAPPLKCLAPLSPPHSKKLAPPLFRGSAY